MCTYTNYPYTIHVHRRVQAGSGVEDQDRYQIREASPVFGVKIVRRHTMVEVRGYYHVSRVTIQRRILRYISPQTSGLIGNRKVKILIIIIMVLGVQVKAPTDWSFQLIPQSAFHPRPLKGIFLPVGFPIPKVLYKNPNAPPQSFDRPQAVVESWLLKTVWFALCPFCTDAQSFCTINPSDPPFLGDGSYCPDQPCPRKRMNAQRNRR